ncbi:hypothetical protein F4677DRAFT_432468 [Hypoxylon crocopeplum]|nr:hypothetical protein F4677DRAFT_432468 [Hypoxylon crocopeplum]
MSPHPQLKITIPPRPFPFTTAPLPLTIRRNISPLYGPSELQVQLKAIVRRVTGGTTATNTVFKEPEGRRGGGDFEDNDAGSDYGDVDDNDVQPAGAVTGSDFELESIDNSKGMCSPECYAEFAVNPYSCTDSIIDDGMLDSQPEPEPKPKLEPEQEIDYFSLPVASSRKRRSDSLDIHQRKKSEEWHTESMKELLASNLNNAYSAIRTEETASLRLLQELCTC